jgi:hypothetical protein
MTIAFTARSYSRVVPRYLLIVVVLAVLAAGCGHGSGAQRKHYASADAFAAAADGVCSASRTRGTRLARLHGLVPPPAERDLFARWLNAEQDAFAAAKAIAKPTGDEKPDPQVQLAIAEGKIAGYARRLGAVACTAAPPVTMPS